MNQIVSDAFVLKRIDFGEADRIITVITPVFGKRAILAKAVRKSQSKLAGGVEIFNLNNLTFLEGKSQLATLTSSRLNKAYRNIINDINKLMFGYDTLKFINKYTEENCDSSYFNLLEKTLEALNDKTANLNKIKLWFFAQLMQLDGSAVNTEQSNSGDKLLPNKKYQFSFDNMTFFAHDLGQYQQSHIKLLRIAKSQNYSYLDKLIVDQKIIDQTAELTQKAITYA